MVSFRQIVQGMISEYNILCDNINSGHIPKAEFCEDSDEYLA
jgi:hypothetical protein